MATNPISLIVPVFNDAECLGQFLSHYFGDIKPNCHPDNELIVVLSEQSKAELKICEQYDLSPVVSEVGRGIQMNTGASRAKNNLLWFIHVDTRYSLQHISDLELLSESCWGCFDHKISPSTMARSFIAYFDNLRARCLQIPYGDQGIFCSKKLFAQVGGYPESPILEDVMLAENLKKLQKINAIKRPLYSNARRWMRLGMIRTTWLNWKVMYHYYRGNKNLSELKALYQSGKFN